MERNLVFGVACRRGKNGLYKCLEVDLGYGIRKIFVDSSVLLELLNYTPLQLSQMKEDEVIIISKN